MSKNKFRFVSTLVLVITASTLIAAGVAEFEQMLNDMNSPATAAKAEKLLVESSKNFEVLQAKLNEDLKDNVQFFKKNSKEERMAEYARIKKKLDANLEAKRKFFETGNERLKISLINIKKLELSSSGSEKEKYQGVLKKRLALLKQWDAAHDKQLKLVLADHKATSDQVKETSTPSSVDSRRAAPVALPAQSKEDQELYKDIELAKAEIKRDHGDKLSREADNIKFMLQDLTKMKKEYLQENKRVSYQLAFEELAFGEFQKKKIGQAIDKRLKQIIENICKFKDKCKDGNVKHLTEDEINEVFRSLGSDS